MLRKGRMLLATITAALCAGTLIAAVACSEDPVEPKPEGNTYTVTYTAGYTGATDPDLTESHKEGEQFTLRAADAFSRGGGVYVYEVERRLRRVRRRRVVHDACA